MARKETGPNETVVHLKTGNTGRIFLQQNGAAANRIKEVYGLKYELYKTKLRLISNENSADAAQKRVEAEKIVKTVLGLQEENHFISPKHLESLIKGEQLPVGFKETIKDSGKTVKTPVFAHPRAIEFDLDNDDDYRTLFSGDRKFVKMIESIFDTKILPQGGKTVSMQPSGKPSRKPSEKIRETLVVSQAQTVLTAAAKLATKEPLSERMLGFLALTAVTGQPNEEKTKGRIQRTLGAIHFPEFTSGEQGLTTEAEQPVTEQPKQAAAPTDDNKNRSFTTQGDFGSKFVDDLAIENLFNRKFQMDMKYYGGGEQKRLTLTKRKNAKASFDKAFEVVAYAQRDYMENGKTLNPDLVENAIDNVLNNRPVDYVSDEKRQSFEDKKKRHKYAISTFNDKQSENYRVYPQSESQYEMFDMMLGKPSNNPEKGYFDESARIGLLVGPAGSGKTFMGVAVGVHAYNKGYAKNVYFLRPNVGTNGKPPALVPGDMKTKSAAALAPIYENLEIVMPIDVAAKVVREPVAYGTAVLPPGADPTRKFEIGDAAMYRGRTLKGYCYVDEGQNLTREEIRMMMTRVGKGSHLNISIDLDQIDLANKRMSGGPMAVIALYEKMKRGTSKHIKAVVCNGNQRDEVVDEALDMFHAFDTNNREQTRENRVYTLEHQYEQALMIYYGTTDQKKVAEMRDREQRYGYEKTGYSMMRENMNDFDNFDVRNARIKQTGRVIDMTQNAEEVSAREEAANTDLVSKTVAATISELVKQGVLKIA